MKTVSVIIPTYNYGKFLPNCLNSVLNQNLDKGYELEIIVVDDGSTDNTQQILSTYKTKNMLSFYQKNSGVASARNKGLSIAKGEYILFLDADDILLPNNILNHLRTFETNKETDKKVNISQGRTKSDINGLYWPLFLDYHTIHLLHTNFIPIHSAMIKRELVEKVKGFDVMIKNCEDYDFWLRATLHDARLVNTPTAIAIYNIHKNSLSTKNKNLHILADFKIQVKMSKYLKLDPNYLRGEKYLGYLALSMSAYEKYFLLTTDQNISNDKAESYKLQILQFAEMIAQEALSNYQILTSGYRKQLETYFVSQILFSFFCIYFTSTFNYNLESEFIVDQNFNFNLGSCSFESIKDLLLLFPKFVGKSPLELLEIGKKIYKNLTE